jgi:hypothetical protein
VHRSARRITQIRNTSWSRYCAGVLIGENHLAGVMCCCRNAPAMPP